jgi:regulator of protease activity HflC (stomatin/prohibitin superfamily)
MSDHFDQTDRPLPPNEGNTRPTAALGTGLIFLILGMIIFGSWFTYTKFRIDVPNRHMAILVKKTGLDIANGDEVAPSDKYKGVKKEVLREGRYFYNPWVWDWKVIPQVEIAVDKLGVLVSLTGEDLPYGEFLAKLDDQGNPLTKGIMAGVLKPGRYQIHPYLYLVEDEHKPVVIEAGYKGVVTNLAGPFPKKANTLLVEPGERGVQQKTHEPGTYYINPYVTRISKIDCRSQRFDLANNKDMGFPSRDGFWISLDGRIEFRVNPEMAAEVFVTYNDEANGDRIDEEIILKIITPNARSFCRLEGSNSSGREFISGETKVAFQNRFQKAMQQECQPLGIEIIQALITDIKPPEKIRDPVREKELAKQQEKAYQQEIMEQMEEQKQAVEQQLVEQKKEIVKVNTEVVMITIKAEQKQQVDVTVANQRKAVADLKLAAARDEAEAILAHGKAAAEVIGFQNEAVAAGWKRAVEAFSGRGDQYAQYVLYKKLAGAYRKIMVNTADSPIMKIFDSFTPAKEDSTPEPAAVDTAAGPESTSPDRPRMSNLPLESSQQSGSPEAEQLR